MKKYTTLKIKIAFTAVLLVFITVLSIVLFMTMENKRILLNIQESNARNLLKAVVINVKNEYRGIELYKANLLEEKKSVLKDIINITFMTVERFYQMYQKGIISEKEAKRLALKTVRTIRYENNTGYVWINDTGKPYPRMIMHPILPQLDGTVLNSPDYNCALGKNKNLFQAFVDITAENGQGFVRYLWPKPLPGGLSKKQPKLSYVKRFTPWGWILGTGLYMDDIEEATKKRINAVIENLQNTFPEMKTYTSDYISIFNSNYDIVVHPLYKGEKQFRYINPATGNKLLADLIAASKTPEKKLVYTWNKVDNQNTFTYKKIAYISYFKPLDWYIVSSFYLDKINNAPRILSRKIFLFSTILLVITGIFSILMVFSFTKPFVKIMDAFKKGIEGDYSARLYIQRNDELGQLAFYFNKFMERIDSYNKKLTKEIKFNTRMIQFSPSYITAIDTKGKILMINRTMLKACGYTMDEVQNKDYINIFIDSRERESVVSHFSSMAVYDENLPSQVHTNYILTKKRERILVEWYDTIIENENGEIDYYFGVGIDITDRRKAEEQLLQAQKMETIGTLAGGLAHDFNNVLGGIIGTLSIIKYKLQKNTLNMEQMKDYLKMLEQSGNRATDMVKQLLTLSRKQDISKYRIDLSNSIKHVIKIAENSFDKSVILHCSSPDTPACANADPTQIEQVLLNICINAVHAMTIMRKKNEEWGGILSLSLQPFTADEHFVIKHPGAEKKQYWMIQIEDTGVGIPDSLRNHIFTPFFTTKKKEEGTGLGLSTSYNIIKQHNGFMDVHSERGTGSRFTLYIPALDTDEEKIKSQKEKIFRLSVQNGLILVIDDEEIMRINAKTILEECGYTVILAQDGEEGLHILSRHSKEIKGILLDISMPKLSGKETFIKIKEMDPSLKVLITSGYKKDTRVNDVLKMGGCSFIQKPYTLETLSRALENLLK